MVQYSGPPRTDNMKKKNPPDKQSMVRFEPARQQLPFTAHEQSFTPICKRETKNTKLILQHAPFHKLKKGRDAATETFKGLFCF